jgi:DNA topoisomerase-1
MKLLIVESPTKAHTIKRFLGKGFIVLSTRGHIKDLPKSQFGIDIENGFVPRYITIRGKGKIIAEIKRAAIKSEEIYVGTDPDREGEAIAYHITEAIKNGKVPHRVLFYEITKPGIKKGLENPTIVDQDKVNAHMARRVLDRLVGYLVSPILWKAIKSGLSAGRVQTVALRLIVEREREIQQFIPEEYWDITASFLTSRNEIFSARLKKINRQEATVRTQQEAEAIKNELLSINDFIVSQYHIYNKSYKPPAPFITATLQQEAAKVLNFSAKKTMFIAQELFEGVKIGSEATGLITYPRTDSLRIAEEFIMKTREFIKNQWGEEYLPLNPPQYRDRLLVQGAHEAIRPTYLGHDPQKIKRYLTPDQYKLYNLIYCRYVASQMAPAVYEITEVEISSDKYLFTSQGIQQKFDGFEKLYKQNIVPRILPRLNENEKVSLKDLNLNQRFTEPPARYSEASLIKKLQINGIGRPSTYASIISTILERRYVIKKEGRLFPTKLGMLVNDILIKGFNDIFEVNFTKKMEEALDLIEARKESWQEVVKRFYLPFKEDLEQMEKNALKIKEEIQETLPERCPICQKSLVKRWGRFGEFTACAGYPECNYVKKDPPQLLDKKCPECGLALVERSSRYGKFIACSGYPKCRYIESTKSHNKILHENCPECGSSLVERKGKYGRFISCSRYPECRYRRGIGKKAPLLSDKDCEDSN